MKIKGKKTVFIVAITSLVILSLLIFSSIPGSPLSVITGPISFITDPIQKFMSDAVSEIEGFISSVKDSEQFRKKNEELVDENARLEMIIKELEENGRRWDELKDALKIRDTFSDYELIGASILTREIGDWFDVFRISAGIRDGIVIDNKTSYAVVDAQMNLVGRVYSSDLTSSKILPILNEGSVISAKMNTAGGAVVRVRGDVILKESGYCLVDNISDFSTVNIGDEVITSGLGGLFPPGIPIGLIVEIGSIGTSGEKTAILKVYTEYKMLKDIFILKGKYSD